MPEVSSVTALLGPTNTGKTHRAIERMLEHDSGMIGLPLRLLAREVYDRVTARVGEARVALVTGEEKRIPAHAEYWICTVEAMPVERTVDFLAVDEIQLCAHPQRGHVFTERLLSARGRKETWFLGSDSMREAVRELVPVAQIESHPRLSSLTFAGAGKLSRVPARSAVVAFSTAEVYEVAERMKAMHGGTAVVLGALSPRTRNAQVAMFQAGEVDRMVATDAIGMGLNLDVRHVAFSSLRKFDGRDVRGLDPAEMAQIAGRAGRYQNDGTFGSVIPVRIAPDIAADIETHRFAPVRRLIWRNSELEFGSVEALIASLHVRPRSRWLRQVENPDDTAALESMAKMPAVLARAQGNSRVKLLWDVCTVPDFRKLLLGVHVELLAELYDQLSGPAGVLDEDWLDARVSAIDDPRGDVDTLMGRVAAIRTFTYVAHRTGWIARAREWQERTRDVEDRLSDALHDALVERFVDRARPRPAPTAAPRSRVRLVAESNSDVAPPSPAHPFASLARMRAALSPGAGELAADETPAEWVESLVGAAHTDFTLDERGRIAFRDRAVGQLVRGSRLVLPDVKPLELGELGAGARSRILRRLVAFARDAVGELNATLRAPALREVSPPARRLLYLLEQSMGTASGDEAREVLRALRPDDRARLRDAGIEPGRVLAYTPEGHTPEAVAQRAVFCAAYFGWRESARAPGIDAPVASLMVDKTVDPEAYRAMGYPVFGTRAVRADIVERVAEALRAGGPGGEVSALAALMGCAEAEVPWVVDGLG